MNSLCSDFILIVFFTSMFNLSTTNFQLEYIKHSNPNCILFCFY